MQAEARGAFPQDASFLVIRRDNIGDLVCTTPLIHALRQHYPHARICALVNSYNAPVLENNPDLDQVYAYTKLKHRIDGSSAWRVLWGRLKLMASLRRQRFDCAIIAGARFLPRGLRLARTVRPRHIIGFTEQGRGGSRAIDMAGPYELPRPMHEVEDVFRLLGPLGIHDEPPSMLIVPDTNEIGRIRSRIETQRGVSGKRLIGIHISARKPSNRWSSDRFVRLIKELHARYDTAFMLFWSPGAEDHPHHPGDDAMAARVTAETQGVPLLPCATNRLEELIAGLSCCDAVVCSDGGALHIAAALGKPILCFFGDSDRTRWYPWKVPHVLLQPASRSVGDIGVDEALRGFEQLLEQCRNQGTGLSVLSACLMHLNTQYVYPGDALDLDALFKLQDVTELVAARGIDLPSRLAPIQQAVLQPEPPPIEPDEHCHTPYECPYWAHCTREKPVRWIYHLPGSLRGLADLARQSVTTIDEIPDGVKLSTVQRRVKDNVEWISPKLKETLATIRYPVHHLDFETIMPGIPCYPDTKPYEPVPVQWSNHIEEEPGCWRHQEYLHREASDPREALTAILLESLGSEGSICVYSPYELSILERLAERYPSMRAELKRVIRRLWDLFPVIRDHYYHPAFGGSYSIKSVLPAMVPSLAYGDLAIQEGGVAAQAYYQMVFKETDWVNKEAIKESLLAYCKRDTLAMVELRRALWEKAG